MTAASAASAAVSASAASAGRIPTPADLDPSPGPVDVRTALALLGLPGALELDDDAARAAGDRALDAARGADLTTAEAAAILRTSRQALESLCETGALTAYRAPGSGHWRITRASLTAFRTHLTRDPAARRAITPTRRRRRGRDSRTTGNAAAPAPVGGTGA